jgi:hypothetical protein
MTFTKENSEKARLANAFGRRRQREQREKSIQEVEKLTSELLSGLGRPPVGGEVVCAETIAATTIEARRLREMGRSDADERKLLRQMFAISPFGLMPAPPPATFDVGRPGAFRVVEKGEEA